jgi:hypothetical protein
MEKHTMYLTQNLIDFLGSLRFGMASEIAQAYSERLQRKGMSVEAADEAADEAIFELHQRVSQFRTKDLFQS